jgi:hypothetical protein
MILFFGRGPELIPAANRGTEQFLYALRPWLPPFVRRFAAASNDRVVATNARIFEALERPIPMRFPNGTPLEDVVKSIRVEAVGPDGQGIPIHIDPVGLNEAEQTIASPVVIDLEGVPLKTSLRLALEELGLEYRVREGVLVITAPTIESTPRPEDPDVIVADCALALLGAVAGALLAPLVADRPRES